MAFGFEFQQPMKQYIPKEETLIEASVIAVFREDGEIKPLQFLVEEQQERYVYHIQHILYKTKDNIGGIQTIRFGIRLLENNIIPKELIYYILSHEWKIKV